MGKNFHIYVCTMHTGCKYPVVNQYSIGPSASFQQHVNGPLEMKMKANII